MSKQLWYYILFPVENHCTVELILLSSMSRNVLSWKVGKISSFTYRGLFWGQFPSTGFLYAACGCIYHLLINAYQLSMDNMIRKTSNLCKVSLSLRVLSKNKTKTSVYHCKLATMGITKSVIENLNFFLIYLDVITGKISFSNIYILIHHLCNLWIPGIHWLSLPTFCFILGISKFFESLNFTLFLKQV